MRNLPEPIVLARLTNHNNAHSGCYELTAIDLKILAKCFEQIDLTGLTDLKISHKAAVFAYIEDIKRLSLIEDLEETVKK